MIGMGEKTMKTPDELYKEIAENAGLRKAYSEAVQSGKTAEFLKAHGVDASAEELKAFLAKKNGEISDEELDGVAGGGCGSTLTCSYCGREVSASQAKCGMHDSCYKKYEEDKKAASQKTLL